MNRFSLFRGLLIVLSLTIFISSKPYEYVPADRGNYPKKTDKTAILPQSFLREYDPVTVFFSGKRKSGNLGPENHGERYMTITPQHPGEYIWIDNKTLEFRPTVPWPPVSRFKVEADGLEKELATILTPPKSISPSSGSTDLGKVNEVTLEFAHPVNPDVLKRLVTFESTPLPGIDRSQSIFYTDADYTIKPGEQKSSGSVPYTFIFSNPFSLGHKIRTVVTLSDIPEFSEGKRIYFFETKAEFRLVRVGTYSNLLSVGNSGSHYSVDNALPIDQQGRIILEFSSRPQDVTLSKAKSLFNFSPAPLSFDFSQSGHRVVANVKLEPERLYKVTVQPVPIQDQSGRELVTDGPSSFYCYKNPEKHYIRWSESYNILERYGAQHIPLQIANVGSFDLRIFKIDPLNKCFWPFPSSPVLVDEGDRPPGPGEEPPLEKTINSPLSSSDIKKHIKMLGSPHYSKVIDAQRDGILRHQTLDLKSKLETISGKEKSGTYLIGFRELSGNSNRYYVKVQVTDLCISTVESKGEVLLAVTSYRTGKPISGARIAVDGYRNGSFTRLYEERTDREGMCKISGGVLYDKKNSIEHRRVVVSKDEDHLVLETQGRDSPPAFSDNRWTSRGGDWLSLLTRKAYNFERDREYKGFVFPERPIYRPEEKVYLKGYVRSVFEGKYSLPEKDSAELRITGPDNVWRVPLKMTGNGSFDHVFFEENPATGDYSVQLEYNGRTLSRAKFKIDAYRIPRFEVKLHGPDQVPNDQSFTVGLTASYYAGGRVVDCPVRWRVLAYPYSWSLSGWDGYFLSSDRRYSRSMRTSDRRSIDEEGRTDDNGGAELTVQSDAALGGNPTKYIVEATVTDVDEQTVTNYRNVVALPPFVLAMKADRYIPKGNTIRAQVAAVDIHEKAIAGQKVTVTLKKKTWHHYLQETDFANSDPKYVTEENVSVVEQREVTTGSSPLEIVFKDREPGVYIVDLSSHDKLGRLQTLQLDLFLAGEKPVVWKKSEQKVFETVTDKSEYVPGDKANIVLKSPYQNALALAVVESPDGVPEYDWVTISNGQATFSLDITSDMIDRIPVSFLLMRPRVSAVRKMPEGHFVDVGKPKTEANTTWLTVKPTANQVKIALEHQNVQAPGDKMEIGIALTDWKGKPVEGEVTLWLIDEAVLALGEEMNLNPLPSFIPNVSSHINLRDSRNMARGMISDLESPGGDEMQKLREAEAPVKITVRKNFKTVPYYNPRIMIDKSGKKEIVVPLPDNLTRFAIRAVVVSGAERFGFSRSRVSVRLPVIVQPSLPRFVRIGDKFKAGGVARVVEGEGGGGKYSVETDGLDIVSGEEEGKWHPFTFPGKKAQPLFLEMKVRSPGYDNDGQLKKNSITFQMAVRKEKERKGDAFSVSIPLLPDRDPVTLQSMALITKDSSFFFDKISEELRPNTLARQLMICNELPLLKVLAGLRYLMEYPHGCIEQKVSRAYPSLAYQGIWRQIGIEDFDPELDKFINETLAFLKKAQDENGLIGYWPGDEGSVYVTAYAVEFMATVKKYNSKKVYNFPETVYNRACDALERALRSDYSQNLSSYRYFERCAAIYALVKAGRVDMSYLKQLAYQSQGADPLSQARIYSAIIESGKSMDEVLEDLEKELWDHTVFKLRDGSEVYNGLQQGSSRIGAEVHGSEIGSLAGLVGALSQKTSMPQKVDMMAHELVVLGSADGWGNTHNNSLAMLALRDRLKNKKKSNEKVTLALSLGNEKKKLTYKEKDGLYRYNLDSKAGGGLRLADSELEDSVHVKLFQRYLPVALGSDVAAAQEGFVVKRQIIFPSGSDAPSKKIWIDEPGKSFNVSLGGIIEEHIQVTNPSDRYFVAVVIPLAAGFEYLNPELKTASSEFKPEGKTSDSGSYQTFYDDKIVYYFKKMGKGTFDFYFRVRATTEGTFSQPPAYSEMMYEEEIRGNSCGTQIRVVPEK